MPEINQVGEVEQKPEQDITEEDAIRKLAEAMSGNAPTQEEKQNVFTFLTNVVTSDDTTKIGYLRDDETLNELGLPKLPVRALQSMALISGTIMNNKFFQEYFMAESEIVTKTSLSRDGKLINLSVIQKREIADTTTKPRKQNKSWFKPKRNTQQNYEGVSEQ